MDERVYLFSEQRKAKMPHLVKFEAATRLKPSTGMRMGRGITNVMNVRIAASTGVASAVIAGLHAPARWTSLMKFSEATMDAGTGQKIGCTWRASRSSCRCAGGSLRQP